MIVPRVSITKTRKGPAPAPQGGGGAGRGERVITDVLSAIQPSGVSTGSGISGQQHRRACASTSARWVPASSKR